MKEPLPGGLPEKDLPYKYLTLDELKEELEKAGKKAAKEAEEKAVAEAETSVSEEPLKEE